MIEVRLTRVASDKGAETPEVKGDAAEGQKQFPVLHDLGVRRRSVRLSGQKCSGALL